MKQQRTHTDVHTQTHAKHTHLENLGTIDKWVNVNLNFFHSFEQSTWICFKCFCVGQVGVQLVAPQLLQASPSPQVWGSLLLSGKAGHQMASASHLTAPGSLIFDTVHVCVCACHVDSTAILQRQKDMLVITTSRASLILPIRLCSCVAWSEMESECVGRVGMNRNTRCYCPEIKQYNVSLQRLCLFESEHEHFTRIRNVKMKQNIRLVHSPASLEAHPWRM